MKGRYKQPAAQVIEQTQTDSFYAAGELIRRERFIGEVYDPGDVCLNGIADAFVKNGNAVFMTSQDFLTYDRGCINVVSEPRPEVGAAFARRGLELCIGKVALLLPVPWMTTTEAKDLFENTPIARIYILTKRLRFRTDGKHRLAPMAWFLWERGHFERPVLILI